MNLDTRARRAADGVRASTQGVDPMGQVTELKREDKARRRNGAALGGLAALLVIVGAAWFTAANVGGGSDALPATPGPSTNTNAIETPYTYQPGQAVGTRLNPPLVTRAPKGWDIPTDESYVWLGQGVGLGPHIEIGGPLLAVYDQETGKGMAVPSAGCIGPVRPSCSGYADWLRANPSLTVLADREVSIDGQNFPQLTVRVNDDATLVSGSGGVLLGKYDDGSATGPSWERALPGETFSETIIRVGKHGDTYMVVKASGAKSPEQQAELEAALAGVLDSMKLPT